MTDDIRFLHFLSSFREMSQCSAFINIVSLEVNSIASIFINLKHFTYFVDCCIISKENNYNFRKF